MKKMCPYCEQKLEKLTPAHLKKHGKTRQDVRNEFPEYERFFHSMNERLSFKEVLYSEIEKYNFKKKQFSA